MARQRRGTERSIEVDGEVVVLSRRAAKEAAKAEKQFGKAAKADRKAREKEEKAGKRDGRKAGSDGSGEAATDGTAADPVTGAKVKRYIGIARVVVPVVAPLVYQAAGSARARWDEHRARQLGVAPEELGDFTGRGATLYARIHNLATSTRELAERRGGDDGSGGDVRTFADETSTRLADLEAAVRSAEQMPAARRRQAHVAVAGELDRVETRLLAHWGVDGGPSALRA